MYTSNIVFTLSQCLYFYIIDYNFLLILQRLGSVLNAKTPLITTGVQGLEYNEEFDFRGVFDECSGSTCGWETLL